MSNQAQHLILTEAGYEEPLASWQHYEVDEPEWVSLGWQAVTYDGVQHFFSKDQPAVVAWLTEQGYVATGDGLHYEKPEEGNS